MADGRVVARAVLDLEIGLALVATVGALLVLTWPEALSTYLVTNAAIGGAGGVAGWLILRAKPHHRVGRYLLGLGLAGLLSAAAVPVRTYGVDQGWPSPVLRALVTLEMSSWGWGLFVCLPIALLVFPTGAYLGRRWRWLARGVVAFAVVGSYGTGPTPDLGADSYLVLPGHEVAEAVLGASVLIWPLCVVALVERYRHSDDLVRRQVLWLLLALLVALAVNAPWAFSLHSGSSVLILLSICTVPAAAAVGLLRPELLDVQRVVSRLALYELLSAAVVLAYLGLVAVLDGVLQGRGAPVLATLAVALAFNPARTRLQRLVDRALYGAARDPVRVVSVVGERLADEDLTSVLDGLRQALRVPYAAIEAGGRLLAASGHRPARTSVTTLTHRDEVLGQLVVGARSGERNLPATDRRLLSLLEQPLSVAVRAYLLASQLQLASERVVEVAADERRRLHRELHDSLGPVLTGAALKADSVTLSARTDPARTARLGAELADQLRAAITDVRRLVYGLRPPVLDELGLVAALERQAASLGGVRLEVRTRGGLPPLPPSVEVAAYRIASEAVTNVVRHAGAEHVVLSLAVEDSRLELSVVDDGASSQPWVPGVGLESMRQRVLDLGGRYEAGPRDRGGRVAVVLPLGATP